MLQQNRLGDQRTHTSGTGNTDNCDQGVETKNDGIAHQWNLTRRRGISDFQAELVIRNEHVTVTVRNVATGVATTATTSQGGVYDIPWVETGVYSVTFTKPGFEQVVRDVVDIHVATVTVDATM